MSRRDAWQQTYERFDPVLPPARSAWRAARLHSPVKRIVERLDVPFGNPRILLAGTVGTGKSTELLRVADARADKELVVVLDLYRLFSAIRDGDALQRIDSWEVVFQAGLAVLAAAQDSLPYLPKEHVAELQKAWEKMAEATDTPRAADLDLGKIASGMVSAGAVLLPLAGLGGGAGLAAAAGTGIVKAAVDGLRKTVPLGRSKKSLPDQDDVTQSLLGAVNVIIGYVQHTHRRVLLIIDGLDRIREEERALQLLLRSELLGQLACRTLICAPFALRSAPSAAAVPRFDKVVIANEPVMDRHDPSRPGPGIDFFREVYRLRTSDLGAPDLIPDDCVRKLAYSSGGRARDFVKLVRETAERAWSADVDQANLEIVDQVIDEARRERESGLDRGHIDLLREVMNDPVHELPNDPMARKLLDWGHLLPYPNESEWYYPHPLLTLHLLQRRGSTG